MSKSASVLQQEEKQTTFKNVWISCWIFFVISNKAIWYCPQYYYCHIICHWAYTVRTLYEDLERLMGSCHDMMTFPFYPDVLFEKKEIKVNKKLLWKRIYAFDDCCLLSQFQVFSISSTCMRHVMSYERKFICHIFWLLSYYIIFYYILHP